MGLKDAMISLVGDFVQMNRNPEFRSKNELNKDAAGTSGSLGVPNLSQRRHSLNITVGTEGPPETFVRPRTYSVCSRDGLPQNSPSSAHKKAMKNRRFSAPCILKEPPTFQLSSRRNRKTSESNAETESTEISSSEVIDRPRKPIIKKQKSEDFPESDSSDDSNENSDFQRRRMKQNSPRLANSGFFKSGSFRNENIIEEEPENEGGTSPCINSNVTIITTRF